MRNDFEKKEIRYIEDVISIASKYLNQEITNLQVINSMNWLSSEVDDNNDPNILMFKGIWSDIDDKKDEIKKGKITQQKLDDFIAADTKIITEVCKEIIEDYTPILAALQKKYDIISLTKEEDLAKW